MAAACLKTQGRESEDASAATELTGSEGGNEFARKLALAFRGRSNILASPEADEISHAHFKKNCSGRHATAGVRSGGGRKSQKNTGGSGRDC